MTDQPGRRFTIADAMILTAAAAVGAYLSRLVAPGYQKVVLPPVPDIPVLREYFQIYWAVDEFAPCVLLPLAAAQVAARLRSPRPRRVRDEPGFVASLAVLAALAFGVAWAGRNAALMPPLSEIADDIDLTVLSWWSAIEACGTAVLGAWPALVLARRWRPRADWVDRFGRALGWAWIALFAGLHLAFTALAVVTWGIR